MSHFFERATAAQAAGYDVFVVARQNVSAEKIKSQGFHFIPIAFSRRSLNIISEIRVILSLLAIYQEVQPDIVHHVASKPILYGTLAAKLSGVINVVNAIVGMGYVFTSNDLKARLLKPLVSALYRFLMNPKGSKVVFENGDDLAALVKSGIVHEADAVLIRGAGVDVEKFRPHASSSDRIPNVTLVARMLKDKGVYEFVAAAKIINANKVKAKFILVGSSDDENPSSISTEMLKSWDGQFGVEWWGWRDDVISVLEQTDIACLPSYREGLPKSLLEAASVGLPIVTTDTTGCREVVINDFNGYLVPVKNVEILASALNSLIDNPSLRLAMGHSGRDLVIKEFSSIRVNSETLFLYGLFFRQQKVKVH